MPMTLDDLLPKVTAQLNEFESRLSAKSEEALKQVAAQGDMSASLKDQTDKLASQTNLLREGHEELKASLKDAEQLLAGGRQTGITQIKSAGQLVVEDESIKAFAASVQAGQRKSVPMPRAALISTGVATGVVEPQRLPGMDAYPKPRLYVRDLLSAGRTNSPAIFWVQVTGFTNAAAVVVENTTKPYSDLAFATKITAVTTIAHMFKASKQILDDMAQLGSLIDSEMRFGLKQVEETQLLFGDGTGINLDGIYTQASAYAAPTGATAPVTPVDQIRVAMLQAQLARLPPSGVVMHFVDWANIEMYKDSLGRYIIGNPQGSTTPQLWNLPVVGVETAAMLGKFLTGAFKSGAQIFDREDANVVISTENVDDFEKNMISIRCEERLGLAVYRPEAFIKGTLVAYPTP